MGHIKIWNQVIELLKLQLPPASYDAFFASAVPKGFDNKGNFVIELPNEFSKEMVEEKFCFLIEGILSGLLKKKINLVLKVKPVLESEPKVTHSKAGLPLNPKYTFKTFVVGSSNQFAHAVSQAVCKSPGKLYNPLFIYGGVGLGKTHLMQAIGHEIMEKYKKMKVVYVSAENFTNELINAISQKKTSAFRKKYRKVDVLLVDDVQFLANKESTQEEFFHTFNELFQKNKQIVLSSDRPPKKIKTLQDRLVNRFESGLLADIQPPDLELRVAILKKEAEIKGVEMPEDVILFIAENITSNIRELEGAFIKVIAYSSLEDKPITKELVIRALGDILEAHKQELTVEYIQEKVAAHYEISVKDLLSKKRSSNIALPRQVAIYLVRTLLDIPLQAIGEKFGGRDHATIIHSCKKIEDMMRVNQSFREEVEKLQKELTG